LSLVTAHKIQVAELQATVADLKAQQVMQQATATQSAEQQNAQQFSTVPPAKKKFAFC
jgi:hypothetical protein